MEVVVDVCVEFDSDDCVVVVGDVGDDLCVGFFGYEVDLCVF